MSSSLTSSQLRSQIEGALARKAPSALTPAARAVRPAFGTGVREVDDLLEGGLPVGAISEFTGPACSGRVSLALAFLAGQTRGGQVCAWMDASDGFDPASASATGVVLERLLWVRCGPDTDVAAQHTMPGSRFAVQRDPEPNKGCYGMHPRMEERGLSTAIEGMLQPRPRVKPGTPSAPNRPLSLEPRVRVEQIASDRLPARRGEHALQQKSRLEAGENGVVPAVNNGLAAQAAEYARVAPRCAETQQGFARARQTRVHVVAQSPGAVSLAAQPGSSPGGRTTWDRLDQAVRTTDLLLQGGGFSTIVMDLSGVDAEFANRIPLATWFRFRAAADRTRTSLLVLSRHPCTGSSGEVLLRMIAGEPAGDTVLSSIPLHVELARQRFTGSRTGVQEPDRTGNLVTMRKPPRSATDWKIPTSSLKAAGLVR